MSTGISLSTGSGTTVRFCGCWDGKRRRAPPSGKRWRASTLNLLSTTVILVFTASRTSWDTSAGMTKPAS